jgi:putative peptidoglycan lipid II flippase
VVIGAVLYLLVQIPSVLKLTNWSLITDHFSLGLQDSNVRQVLTLMGPRLLGVAIVQLNFWVNTWLASQMVSGSVTGLYYGFSLMLMAQAVIAQSAAIAVMPTFSSQHALGQKDEMRSSLAATLRSVILLALPASAGLILLRRPLISLLYQRGEFDARAVEIVAWALLWYAAGMVGHAIMEILTRAFYAQHDTKTPVIIGTVAMALNIVFSIAFIKLFEFIGWMPHGGLALANSMATALEAIVLFIVMQKRLNGIEGKFILRGIMSAALGVLAMSFAIFSWRYLGQEFSPWIITPVGVIIGGGVYFTALWFMRVPELQYMVNGVLRRLKRS